MDSLDTVREENRRLRRTVGDLVALSTLPALWAGLSPEGIMRSLADVLVATLPLDLVYIRFGGAHGEEIADVVRGGDAASAPDLDRVRASLASLLAAEVDKPAATIEDPGGDGALRAVVTRFGVGDGQAVLVSAARRGDFPTDRDRALLGIGANQAAIVVQRRRAEEQLHERQEWLRQSEVRKGAILDVALDSIVTMDDQGRVVEFNPAAERTFGYRSDDVVGRPLAELIIPPALRERHRQGLARYLATGEGPVIGRRIEVPALHADGTEFPVELAITRIPIEGPALFTAYLRDISERVVGERHRNVRLGIAQVLATSATVAEAAEASLRTVCEALEWDVGFFWSAEPDTETLRCIASWHAPGIPATRFEAASRERRFHRGEGLPGRTWATGEPVWLLDVVAEPNFPRAASAAEEGLHGALACPLRVGEETVGVIEFFSRRIREPDADLLETMSTACGLIAQFVDRKRAERRRQELLESLRDSEEKLRLLADTIPQLAWMAHPDGDIFWYNQRWYEYTGTTPEQMMGWGWQAVHDPEMLPTVMERWTRSLATGEVFEMVFPLRGADGELRPFLTRVAPLRDARENILYWCGTNTDISAMKRMEEALREADRRKDEFLATLAHELRNPLAPIANSIQILKMSRVDGATVEKTTATMERQLHLLVRLVDDLLDVSRVMRGKIDLRRESVELASVVARAVETAEPLIDVRGHRLELALPSESLLVDADPMRLSQVVGNLLTNAAKYTEPGGHITVSAERQDGQAVLRVSDDGIGIAPDVLPHVFDLFVQVDQATTRSQGGLGIGLTLVKNLVDLHGGAVEASSDGLGKGSEFVVRLPLATADAAEPSPDARPAEPPSSGRRILVVDDNQDSSETLALLLRLQGHEVEVANDGPAALAKAAAFRPMLILLDIGMPGMDGYEVARRIRQTPGLENTVLTAVTGWGQEEDRRRTAEAGFDHHLVKPVEPQTLGKLVAHLDATPEP